MTDPLDEAWTPQLPPPDFTARVLAADARERVRRRWLVRGAGALTLAAAAAVPLVLWLRRPESGEIVAEQRREVALDHAVAVLEPGAHVRWRGAQVEQLAGDVFYRVDKRTPYRVATALGEVLVDGTCFRVRIHGTDAPDPRATPRNEDAMVNGIAKVGVGVLAGALLTVGVYEGKVRVSSAGQQHALGAGDTVTVQGGATRTGHVAEPSSAEPATTAPPSDSERAYEEANRSLVENVHQLNRKISAAEEQTRKLQKELSDAQIALERSGGRKDADGKPTRHEFDLDENEWKQLAEKGTIKFRTPCYRKPDWQPSEEQLTKIGLAPDDAPALKQAYQQSNRRLWSTIRPLCIAALGNEAAVDKIGPDTCMHLVVDMARDKDKEAASEAMRQVGEIRAGLRAEPAADIAKNPVYQLFSTMTGEAKQFEADLAQHLGPDEAHRVTFSEGLCAGSSTFGGPGAREPKK